ncbi:MAG TPA: metallopeptidase family protein [Myxococcaceae bacterium]|nr:metallopeptidase family protein [Myxococcaceae bacterium]
MLMSRWSLPALVAGLALSFSCRQSEVKEIAPANPSVRAKAGLVSAPPATTPRLAGGDAPELAALDPVGSPTPQLHPHPPLDVCRTPGDPLDAARHLYDARRFTEALSCAAQATAFFPDLPQAYSEKGAALAALGRIDEAALAYARALALAPEHPDALLGAAHLYAVSFPSSREHDELAAVYAERGAAGARAENDRSLLAQFSLIGAMALNDLGRGLEALSRAEEVLRLDRGNREAAYERAVALFELCRFALSRAAFSALLQDEDRGAHAHHHLGLILERQGRFSEADKHFKVARRLAPEDFPEPQLLAPREFKAEIERAVAELPADMRRDLAGVPVTVEDLPREEDLLGGDPPLSPTILGLFRGPPIGERCDSASGGQPCRSVALYRRNLARAVQSRKELAAQIRVTLLHEVGHLRGEDDLELAARGLE